MLEKVNELSNNELIDNFHPYLLIIEFPQALMGRSLPTPALQGLMSLTSQVRLCGLQVTTISQLTLLCLCLFRRGQVHAGPPQRPPPGPSGRGHAARRAQPQPPPAAQDACLERGRAPPGGGAQLHCLAALFP